MIDSCSHREQKDHPFRSGAELRGPSRPERSQNYRTDVLVARAARLSGREGWDNTDSALDNRPLATPSEGWSRAANGASHLYYARQPGRASERKWPPEIGSGPCGHGDSGCPECLDDLHAARRTPHAANHAPRTTRHAPRAARRTPCIARLGAGALRRCGSVSRRLPGNDNHRTMSGPDGEHEESARPARGGCRDLR